MSLREITMFVLTCDRTGCKATAADGTDYSAWEGIEDAYDQAEYAEWDTTRDGNSDYCPEHRRL